MTVVNWPGKSGATYEYQFISNPKNLNTVPGNYAFVKELPNGKFVPLYFGQADDLNARINNHDRWDDAIRAGMTHLMAHSTQGGEKARCAEEIDLIQQWQPVLNTQHRRAV